MTDKMLRVAGRGTDGTAKPIRTDNAGNLGAQLTTRNEVVTFQNVTVNAGASVNAINRFKELNNYSAVVVAVSVSANIDFKLHCDWRIKENEIAAGYGDFVHQETIAELKAQRHTTNYIEMKGSQITVVFTNNSAQQVTANVYLIGIR